MNNVVNIKIKHEKENLVRKSISPSSFFDNFKNENESRILEKQMELEL